MLESIKSWRPTSLRASVLVCAGLIAFCSMPNKAEAQSKVTLRIGHDTIEDYQDAVARFYKEEVERESGGRIQVQIFPANQLGSNSSMNQQVRDGALQGIIQPSAFLTPIAKILGVLDLPFLFPNEAVQTEVLNSPAADILNEALRKQGYEPVAWMTGGFKHFNTTFPVTKADDFKGRVYRTMTSPILVKQYQSWGSTVTAMSFSEVYMGLQQKTIEGHENPADATYGRKLHEVAKYFTISDHGALATVLTLSSRWLNGIEPELQEILKKAGRVTAEKSKELAKPFQDHAIDAMAKEGATIGKLPEEERTILRERAQPAWDLVEADPDMGPALKALQAEIAKRK